MKNGNLLPGSLRLRITSGDLSYVLQELITTNVIVDNVQTETELTAVLSIPAGEYRTVKKIINRTGSKIEILEHHGVGKIVSQLRKRSVLIFGCLVLFILTIFLPTRILFWEVNGNDKISADYIIEQVQSDGISFGYKRSELRSEKIKNMLLDEIPQLEWAGVTTSGCVVIISVREAEPVSNEPEISPGNIVAACDGIVETVTVTQGNPICKPGQAVKMGQVLISGYEDCGLLIKHLGAKGEVFANTYRVVDGVVLLRGSQKANLQSVSRNVAVRIGKKLIKLSKDSGISYAGCDKMYSERCATLPGGFRLPVSLIVETVFAYDQCSILEEDVSGWLNLQTTSYLQTHMLGGTILSDQLYTEYLDDICRFRGAYRCKEQIGINKIEEILSYGENS